MHEKTVLAVCGPVLTPERIWELTAHMDVQVRILKVPLQDALASGRGLDVDLLVIDATGQGVDLQAVERSLGSGGQTSLFVVLDESRLANAVLPLVVTTDFASSYAGGDEMKLRLRRLLWPGETTGDADFLQLGPLTINLASYQVKVGDEPIDLTFMEYALLSFLATHPGRIYSREVLLSQVWGFDYYGGSRTVDVHVRRLRAKLGPEVAQHIETVRGAGYLWNN
ncbi:Transcriptional regulatory protein YycF [Slackia heliotrinireducens]|uniref:Response regulator with CheY-like receiver domain and winged-helix DNA-binding domain n=1 Tax=Slackia heliotrinireducens (strain ATCC 29202 / DSM 20476 / NCTC 11029 / RHS 1) TaxID=471855 RepID=C7N7W6_SLAHD|nr:winged helix-turn-helix domain-containing protein [Slackia heliotrinireducens]ACV23001.1 response regulator with CheY-like receiver domain and winged-helix DNA-binding domain [Slackia heliotrinireducens DSM 20476]VEH01895.1 Transcriptional regulatory protein YycF [Slackia heliotrinireducens]